MAAYTKYTKSRAERALEKLRAGESREVAAQAAGVCRKTLYNWRDENDEFREAMAEADEIVTDGLESVAVRHAMAGNVALLIFLLKSRRREVYGDQQKVEHSGGIDIRRVAEKLAAEFNEPVEAVLPEVERIVGSYAS